MKLLFVGFLVLISLSHWSQGHLGDALFDNFEYTKAIKYYQNDDKLTLNQKENLAYSFYMTQDFVNAEALYQEIVSSDDVEPVFYQFYGISARNNGHYDIAIENFEKIQQIDSSYIETRTALATLSNHKALLDKEQRLEVVNVVTVNNAAASYSPVWYKKGVLFCSELKNDSLKRRPQIDIEKDFTEVEDLAYGVAERPLSAIYYGDVIGSEIKNIQIFAKGEKFHIGNFSIDADDNFYFTKVDLTNKWDPNVRNHPRLFKGVVLNGVITESEKLNIKKLSNEVGAGHPVVTSDGKTIYFSSDKPGGFGGSDLYKITKDEKGNWTEPENLGANINTAGDELSPYLYNEEWLYFASNGHKGFGGLDIFKIEIPNLASQKPVLLDAPINSVSDDFGILIDPNNEDVGFVTSNRFGGNGDDDIYAFRLKLDGIFVQGIVKDLDGNPIANALVKIYDENGNEVAQVRTDENGKYIIELDDKGDYQVVATIPGFGDKELIKIDENWDNHKLLEMVLEPTMTAQGVVKNEDGSNAGVVDVLLKDDKGNIIYTGKTDEIGYYQFPLLQEDTKYIVEATDGNLKGKEEFITDNNFNSLEDRDIILKNDGTFVEGIVLNMDGSPASGVEVRLMDADGNILAVTKTDKDGNYHFDLDKDKDYQILALTDGYEALQNIYTGDNYNENDKLNLQLEPVGKESFALVEDRSSKEGIDNVKVTLVDNETGNKITTTTDKNGKFTVKVKPNHSYTINLDKEGYYPRSVQIESGKKLPEKVDLNQMGDFGMDYAGYKVEKIYFELDESKLTESSLKQLQILVDILKKNPKSSVTISSYADCRGRDKYNISLSYKRSKAVKEYLISQGVKGNRILTKSLGATNFVNNCTSPDACTENEHALNRRSEFEINFKK